MTVATSALDLDVAAERFKALAHPARLEILAFLADPDPACCTVQGEVCACDLEEVTGLSQPTVSHHVRLLVSAGLVTGEKRGRWMHYRIAAEGVADLRDLLGALGA